MSTITLTITGVCQRDHLAQLYYILIITCFINNCAYSLILINYGSKCEVSCNLLCLVSNYIH